MSIFGRIVDLRNNTASDILINDLGVIVPANTGPTDTNVLRVTDFVSAAELDFSEDLETEINAGNVSVNGRNGNGDGTAATNLSVTQSTDEVSITTIESDTVGDFDGAKTGGLNWEVTGGTVNFGANNIFAPTTTSLALTDNMMNYVYVDSSGTITSNTSGYPLDAIPLYEVTTSGGEITSFVDERAYLESNQIGETGIQGVTGLQGVQGVTGLQGAQGTQGIQGDTGAQGVQGDTGTQGVAGAQGTTGLQGIQGTTGVQGVAGAQGTTGLQGTQGDTGVQGVQGIQGATGTQGTQGDTGVGAQGDTGLQGPTGIQGLTGPSGVLTDCPTIQIRRTTSFTIGSGFGDVTFDATDIENDTGTLEHDNTNTDRILINATGLYYVEYDVSIDDPGTADTVMVTGRVRGDDLNILDGSEAETSVFFDTSIDGDEMETHLHCSFYASLTDGTFITLQLQGTDINGNNATTKADRMTFKAHRCAGAQGVQGQTGPAGGDQGETGVQGVTGPVGAAGGATVQTRRTTQFAITGTFQDVTWDTTDVENNSAIIEHDNTNTDNVNVMQDGTYLCTYAFHADPTSATAGRCEFRARLNDTSVIPGSETFIFDESTVDIFLSTHTFAVTLTDGDFITIQSRYVTEVFTLEPDSVFLVTKVDGTLGETGVQGTTGAGGTGDQGATGVQGQTGVQGVQGIQGDTGFGIQGATGVQGTTGVQGETGIQPPQKVWIHAGENGNVSANQFLRIGGNVVSSANGIRLPRAVTITAVSVQNDNSATFDIEVVDESNSVLTTLSVTSDFGDSVTGLSVAVAADKEIRIRSASGNPTLNDVVAVVELEI